MQEAGQQCVRDHCGETADRPWNCSAGRMDGSSSSLPGTRFPRDGDFMVTVHPPGVPPRSTDRFPHCGRTHDHAALVQGAHPLELDLTLVIDTTGSMGDELEYVKSEMRRLPERSTSVSRR